MVLRGVSKLFCSKYNMIVMLSFDPSLLPLPTMPRVLCYELFIPAAVIIVNTAFLAAYKGTNLDISSHVSTVHKFQLSKASQPLPSPPINIVLFRKIGWRCPFSTLSTADSSLAMLSKLAVSRRQLKVSVH